MLSTHFAILSITGVWCPSHWSSKTSKLLYKMYSCFVIFLMYSLGLSQLAQIVFVRHDFKSFNDTFFILLSTNLTCFKAIRILLNQKQVISLMEMFKQDRCLFHDCFEKNIEKRCEYYCRKVAISLLCLCEITGIFLVIAPLFKDTENQELPYKVLLPYDISNPLFYWLTFFHHTIGAATFTAISITTDALIIGFMLHVCAQLDLLQFRLTRFPELIGGTDSWEKAQRIEKLLLAQSVNHHVNIYEISKSVCTVFSEIIISQFCVSAIEISISVYQLSLHMTNVVESCTYLLYLICMLGQLFVYCYFGNEVHLQSKKINYTIFSINYTPLSIELQKDLTLMNLLSSKPIIISCGPFVRLLLDSFTHIVRISYSTFNVLYKSV
ncbi:odorant receptor 13a-like [Copidosoma floridanum]|uniref:odorant receptor 13a-like n=1 Tax=Copidosoma floridanum TaxID=29053 RepID=UPI000C6F8467|nr:odorant receptor 13a-like [Copidosoma floridanum]